MTLDIVLLVAGLAVLVVGAEGLVRGAASLARRVGISPLVVGLTVVAFGTSAPEAAVSLQAALAGRGGLAVGNVVGSNIFNVLLILGISAAVAPLVVQRRLVRLDVPVMIVVSALPLVLGLDGRIAPLEGVLLLAGGLAFTAFLVVRDRRAAAAGETKSPPRPEEPEERPPLPVLPAVVLVVLGLAFLIFGARWLVDGATGLARDLGASELVIGLTVVAVGTSVPEAATSVVAALGGQRDIAVGNVVGSNIFNVLFVLGLASGAGGGVPISPGALSFDLPVMFAVAVACLPIFFTGYVISRWEGAIFLAYYTAYFVFLVLDAAGHEAEPVFTGVMLGFVLPITALTLVVIVLREVRADLRRGATDPEGDGGPSGGGAP